MVDLYRRARDRQEIGAGNCGSRVLAGLHVPADDRPRWIRVRDGFPRFSGRFVGCPRSGPHRRRRRKPNLPHADCTILEAAAGALQAISGDQVAQLWVYRSDTIGTVTTTRNVYRPSQPTDNPASLVCGTWFPISTSWPPSARDSVGTTRDWLGVKILYDHQWQTGFLWWNGSSRWVEDAVMHLEPTL